MDGWKKGGREGRRKVREGKREEGREGGREGEKEEGRKGKREGGKALRYTPYSYSPLELVSGLAVLLAS